MAFYVTTPIFYVNAEPHLGHAYSVIADVFARHMRQRGEDVFFLTGTDEHGEPVELAAEREGISLQELADRNAPRFEAMAASVNATNDFFIRTSDRGTPTGSPRSCSVHDNGHVYEGVYEGWYCPRCAAFYTERELGPGNTCPIHEIRSSARRGELVLPARRSRTTRSGARGGGEFVVPGFRRNEAVSFIEQGLEDVSLSRAKLKWGMPLPWDESQRMYVWFDALLNYVHRALSFARDGEDLTERYWPAAFHVLAKDILKFHAVIWPALLMAAGLEPPRGMVDPATSAWARRRCRSRSGTCSTRSRRSIASAPTPCASTASARCRSGRTARSPPRGSGRRDRARERLRQPREQDARDGREYRDGVEPDAAVDPRWQAAMTGWTGSRRRSAG